MKKIVFSFKYKLIAIALIAIIPMLIQAIFLIASLYNYNTAYHNIINNMTVANSYNLNFKEEMDESSYRYVVTSVPFDEHSEDLPQKSPYDLIADLQKDISKLTEITTDSKSKAWLQSLLRNIDTLKERVDDINNNLKLGGHYDENIKMLDDDIYILTELIQEDIQYYIYYQTTSIEKLEVTLKSQIDNVISWSVLILFVLIILIFTVIVIISKRVEKSISDLCKVTDEIAEGEFGVRAKISTSDELSILADNINDMSRNLEIMVEQIKDDERKMRGAELRLLQEQINPHFLYNTLDTIVWLIEAGKNDEAEEVVVSLSTFFRLVLNKGKEIITVRDEKQHINSYLEIQQIRYRDILEYEIDFEEEIYDYEILKLTLQPIVENALYHGIKNKRAKGKISIVGRMQGMDVKFVISDDGIGMNEEALYKLRLSIKKDCRDTDKGFGLANVNERIRMRYGNQYGVNIDSVENEGTTVTVLLPATKIKEGQES